MSEMKVHGVDISHYQDGRINYGAAKKAGVRWLYHKATEGDGWRDENYGRRRREARRAGLPFGAYHFARPGRGDATAEARHFLSVAQPHAGDMKPMLDLEDRGDKGKRGLTRWVHEFADVVLKETGEKPLLYTPFDLEDDMGLVLWVARYNNSNAAPNVPEPWKRWDIWQFSNGQYGNPDSIAGFGHVDLNTMRNRLSVNSLRLPGEKPEPPQVRRVKFAHCSMQFSDSRHQMKHDVNVLFSRGYDIITGTEAGAGNPLNDLLRDEARDKHYVFQHERSCWVAISRDLAKGRVKDRGYVPVLTAREGEGKHTDRGIVWITVDTDLGEITQGVGHYLTQGRRPSQPNYDLNREYAEAIGKWARDKGRGKALVFYDGDQNTVDRTSDTFYGEPMTSAWDELEKWQNTGHGNIDVIASYDRDSRVSWHSVRSLTDKKVLLNTDHFLVEAVAEVEVD